MARIPDGELDRLKKDVALADLCRRRGIELKGQGENLVACCPFHDDREPSFVITPSKNLWHCFGECNKGGDVIAFIMAHDQVSFRHVDPEGTAAHLWPINGRVVNKSSALTVDTSGDYTRLTITYPLRGAVDYYPHSEVTFAALIAGIDAVGAGLGIGFGVVGGLLSPKWVRTDIGDTLSIPPGGDSWAMLVTGITRIVDVDFITAAAGGTLWEDAARTKAVVFPYKLGASTVTIKDCGAGPDAYIA